MARKRRSRTKAKETEEKAANFDEELDKQAFGMHVDAEGAVLPRSTRSAQLARKAGADMITEAILAAGQNDQQRALATKKALEDELGDDIDAPSFGDALKGAFNKPKPAPEAPKKDEPDQLARARALLEGKKAGPMKPGATTPKPRDPRGAGVRARDRTEAELLSTRAENPSPEAPTYQELPRRASRDTA